MTSLLSGRHKYLTNKNTKKGQKVRKIIALSALKNGYYRVQILSEAVFLKWYLFFCTLYPQTSWLRKSEQTREKPPKSWDFGGSKPWYLFWLHDMVPMEITDLKTHLLNWTFNGITHGFNQENCNFFWFSVIPPEPNRTVTHVTDRLLREKEYLAIGSGAFLLRCFL